MPVSRSEGWRLIFGRDFDEAFGCWRNILRFRIFASFAACFISVREGVEITSPVLESTATLEPAMRTDFGKKT